MKNIILVEVPTDQKVIERLLLVQKLDNIEVQEKGGDSIYQSIKAEVMGDNNTIGIIVDADLDKNGVPAGEVKWQKISSRLNQIGYTCPQKHNPSGTIIEHEALPNVGVWIMPDNESEGIIEDFMNGLINSDDKLLQYVDESISKIEMDSVNRYKSKDQSKAKMATWLSWQEDPGKPLWIALKKRYFDTNHEYCKNFLKMDRRII